MLTKKAKEYAAPLRPLFDSPMMMMMMMMMMMTIMVMVMMMMMIMMMMILGLIQAYMSFASARTSNACGMLVTQISPSRPLPTRCVRSSLAVASHTVVLRGLGDELIRVPLKRLRGRLPPTKIVDISTARADGLIFRTSNSINVKDCCSWVIVG